MTRTRPADDRHPDSDSLVERARVHVFDVDHTLTRHSTGRRFAEAGVAEGLFSRRQLLTLPFFYLRYRMGRLSLRDLSREIGLLAGLSHDSIARVAARAWEEGVRHDLFPQAVAHVAACQDAGCRVVLASTSFVTILEPLASALGIATVIGSRIELVDDVATGWLIDGPCYAEAKAQRVLAWAREEGVDPTTCAFYSDSFHDLPLLERVGSPVAVRPDALLARRARAEGWPIVRW